MRIHTLDTRTSSEDSIEERRNNSYLYAANAAYMEEQYRRYRSGPERVASDWHHLFDSWPGEHGETDHQAVQEAFARLARKGRRTGTTIQTAPAVIETAEKLQVAVLQLISSYRFRGHQRADLDPIQLRERPPIVELEPSYHGLSDADFDTVFNTGSLAAPKQATLREIIEILKDTYCRSIGADYMHITDTRQRSWIQRRLEGVRSQPRFGIEAKRTVAERLIAAEGLEHYLQRKYVGQKRFSLEGAETLIPMLDDLIQRSGYAGVEEIVFGMSHRGRLNVLVNIFGKRPADLFREFEGHSDDSLRSGDVKYHQGFSTDIHTSGTVVHAALAFNPSHLEIVDPVVQGSVRARQVRRLDHGGRHVLPVLVHGDAAFAAQGVVMETLNMSQARGFSTGGTIHVIVNNQIGFTTSSPLDARSTPYCTEVARMVQAPIFHVNGDDPEAGIFVMQLAHDFRMEFRKDVVVDLVCYRRHGHSEADEPSVTQPIMYKKIRNHRTTAQIYSDKLVEENVLTDDDVTEIQDKYQNDLQQGNLVAPNIVVHTKHDYASFWKPYIHSALTQTVDTRVPAELIVDLNDRLEELPPEFDLHPAVKKVMQARHGMARGESTIDWGFGETMAYATLLSEGFQIRLTGQDSGRGTFFHRHAVLHSQNRGVAYVPLKRTGANPAQFTVIDSLLSEEAVLAFEYGYATAEPKGLVIWEAQFGDFANNAQVVFDQFISSGEAKWGRLCGLVVYLPHGYDGQGPEHSSARIERYLNMCAEENMQVCIPTLPAQIFHLLRRQMLRPCRKPLIVFTPKNLLRHPLATSRIDDLTDGGFQLAIDDPELQQRDLVQRVVLCAGKVYYDLLQERMKRKQNDVALVRIEQFYPCPNEEICRILARYPAAQDIVWCQEEPHNQGAWYYVQREISACLGERHRLSYVGRPESSAPAGGYYRKHMEQQKKLVDEALSIASNKTK